MIDSNYFNIRIYIILIYIIQSVTIDSHYLLKTTISNIINISRMVQILSKFPQTKISSNIFKYLIKSVCANALAQNLTNYLISGRSVYEERSTLPTRQDKKRVNLIHFTYLYIFGLTLVFQLYQLTFFYEKYSCFQ